MECKISDTVSRKIEGAKWIYPTKDCVHSALLKELSQQ
jgi:hypothetical protein